MYLHADIRSNVQNVLTTGTPHLKTGIIQKTTCSYMKCTEVVKLSSGGLLQLYSSSDLVLHGVVQEQWVQGPQPLNGVLGAHQGVGPPVTGRHTGHSAAMRLQIGPAAAAEVVELHLPAAGPVQQPAVGQQGHGGQRGVEEGQGEPHQGSLHCGEAVSGGDFEQTNRVLVGHRHVLLLGADSQAEHPGEALWRGDAECLLGQG